MKYKKFKTIKETSEKSLLNKQIGANIFLIRTSKNISQKAFAVTLGHTSARQSYIESGVQGISLYDLVLTAKALDVEITEFFKTGFVRRPSFVRKNN